MPANCDGIVPVLGREEGARLVRVAEAAAAQDLRHGAAHPELLLKRDLRGERRRGDLESDVVHRCTVGGGDDGTAGFPADSLQVQGLVALADTDAVRDGEADQRARDALERRQDVDVVLRGDLEARRA